MAENANGRFWLNDFRVYYSACKAFFSHEQVYGVPFGEDTGLYKYSPLILPLFYPLSLLPYYQASVVFYWLVCVGTLLFYCTLATLCRRIFRKGLSQVEMTLMFVFSLSHLFRELHLGNVNMLMLLITMVSLELHFNGRQQISGALLATVILFKPYFVLLGLPLVFAWSGRKVFGGILLLLLLFFLASLVSGWQNILTMHSEWFTSMRQHNEFLSSYQTLDHLIRTYAGLNDSTLPLWCGALLILSSILYYLALFRRRNLPKDTLFVHATTLVFALIPVIFITDTEHFLFSLPLVALGLRQIMQYRATIALAVYLVILFLYGGNVPDLWGSAFSDRLEQAGVLGLSNLMLIIFNMLIFYRFAGTPQPEQENTYETTG